MVAGAAARAARCLRLAVRRRVRLRELAGLLARPGARVGVRAAAQFRRRHAYWLDDWERFAGPGAVEDQVRFEREWTALRDYAAERGVRLIGDVPIYPADGSCDHLAHPELFRTASSRARRPTTSGRGTELGQPALRLDAVAADGYRWWIERLRRTLSLVDITRIDHFRGFAAYWTIPAEARDRPSKAVAPRPGAAVFDAVEAELGELPVIAEDLGVITPDVEALRDRLGFPGMVVLLWAFAAPPTTRTGRRTTASTPSSTRPRTTPTRSRGMFPSRDHWEAAAAPRSPHARRSRSCRRRTCSGSARRRG